ncbi:MAG TPA: hypothetical protein VGP72_24730 [Planctomycetota bacterium]|jgi:hypothetical protein
MFKQPILMLSSLILVAIIGFSPSGGAALAKEHGLKQPIFLLCPHNAGRGAWSLFFTVDDKDHSKILSLGLETLLKQNSKDSSYSEVIAAQHDPKVKSELVTELDAKDFATLQLKVDERDALHVSLARQADGSMELMISARVSSSGRFTIGGREAQAKRDLVAYYDPMSASWSVKAKTLYDYMGVRIADAPGRVMSGLVFPITGTGIYLVLGVWDNDDVVTLMDRTAVIAGD